jgi:Galactosyltransferase
MLSHFVYGATHPPICFWCRDQADDPQDRSVRAETKEFGDIIRLDSTDTYADLARKTLKLFSKLPDKFDASFYFKVGVA